MKAQNFPTSGLLERIGPGSKALSSYSLPQTEEPHDYHRERNHQGLDNELIDGERSNRGVGRVRR